MYQGVVHTSLRLRSRISNNSLGERLLFRGWNFPHSKHFFATDATDAFGRESEVIWFHESKPKYTPVPGRGYAPAKIFGGAKLVSVHPSPTEKISISLRPGLGLRSPIVERKNIKLQWNLDLTKCQGTGEIGSLYRGFVISRFFSIHYPITGLKNIVRYTEDFVT